MSATRFSEGSRLVGLQHLGAPVNPRFGLAVAVALALSAGCGEQLGSGDTALVSEPTLVDADSDRATSEGEQATVTLGGSPALVTPDSESGSVAGAQPVVVAEPAVVAAEGTPSVATAPQAPTPTDTSSETVAQPAQAQPSAPVGEVEPAVDPELPAQAAGSAEESVEEPVTAEPGYGCPTWYADCDGDGYAPASAASVVSCEKPAAQGECGWTDRAPNVGAADCEDASAAHHPGADYGLMVTSFKEGLAALFCRPDGTYGPKSSRRCVVTSNPDLNCDGKLEAASEGATFCVSGGRCIASLTHECSGADDCSCWSDPVPPCGLQAGVAPNLCPGGSRFTGETALLCR